MARREFGIVLKVTDKGFGVFDMAGEKVKKLGEHTDRASARFQASTERLQRMRAATAEATTQKQNLSLAMQNASEKSLRLTAGSIRLTEAYAQLTTEGGNVGMGLAALTSGFAEIIPLTRDLSKNLADAKKAASGFAGQINALGSSGAGIPIFTTLVIAAGVALNDMLGKMAELTAEGASLTDILRALVGAEVDLAGSTQVLNTATERQQQIWAKVGESIGMTAAEMTETNLTFERMLEIARKDPGGDIARSLEAITAEAIEAKKAVEEMNKKILSGAELVARAAERQAEAIKKGSDALLEQRAPLLDWFSFAEQANSLAAAYERVEKQTGSAAAATKLFGDDITRMIETAKLLGHALPEEFGKVAGAVQAEAAATAQQREQKERIIETLKRARAAHEAYRLELERTKKETKEAAEETSNYVKQLDTYAKFKNVFQIGGTERVDFGDDVAGDAIARLKLIAGKQVGDTMLRKFVASFAANIASGDIEALSQIVQAVVAQANNIPASPLNNEAKKSMTGLAQTLARMLADLQKTIEPRALGGPVVGGQAYMVGERGPELFVPSGSGGIASNQSLGKMEQLLAAIAGETSNLRRDMASGLIQASITEGGVRRLGSTIFDLAGRNELGRA